jgi:ribosomal peptide maturation radical SAM protein 1
MRITLGHSRPPVLGQREDLSPDDAHRRAACALALVTMPFNSVRRPSIQLGTLAPIARSHGFPADTFHLNLDLAARIGEEQYEALCQNRGLAISEWIFAEAAFGDLDPDPGLRMLDLITESFPRLAELGLTNERLREIRTEIVPAYLDDVVEREPWERYRVVGFTSTFAQNTASFALAARLKARHPQLVTVFGGANFDGDMGREWARSIDAVDYVVTGEADRALTRLLVALAHGDDPLGLPGVLAARDGRAMGADPEPPFEDMDQLPVPDYVEYFDRAEAVGLLPAAAHRVVDLPFEAARGCWWGAKRHCTFCGLNGGTMSFRSKSPRRVAAEMAELVRRHRSFDLEAVDNIVDTRYLDELFPILEAQGLSYRMFFEVKADLTRGQLHALRRAGVHMIQPGIESLSSHVLALMRKGTRASTNVNLLRWCRFYGITAGWNMLWGFPGERLADYEEQADLLPNLVHLQPPGGGGRIWMERFSPIYTDRAAFPATRIRPEKSLGYVYPAHVDLDAAAYFFDYELADTLPDEAFEPVTKQLDSWTEAWTRDDLPELQWWHAPGFLQIDDLRRPGEPGTHTFEDPLAAIYLACSDRPTKAAWVKEQLRLPHPEEEVAEVLDEFCRRGLMMRDGNLFLALAIPATGRLHPESRLREPHDRATTERPGDGPDGT